MSRRTGQIRTDCDLSGRDESGQTGQTPRGVLLSGPDAADADTPRRAPDLAGQSARTTAPDRDMTRMSKSTRADLAVIERRRLLAEERREHLRRDAQEVAEGVSETIRLGIHRGEAFEAPAASRGEARKPARRIDGIAWLKRQGKLEGSRGRAAETYRAAWVAAQGEQSLRSCLGEQTGGGSGPNVAGAILAAGARLAACKQLERMHDQLGWQPDLLTSLWQVVGMGKTPREASANGAQASRLEALVIVALDLLAVHLRS